jgi:cytochrome c oxidase subunit 4
MTIESIAQQGTEEADEAISSAGSYWIVFASLVSLTVLTVWVSYADFGQANIVIAVFIASIKALLVALFFMHLRHGNQFHSLAFVSAFLFLALFMLLTHDDLRTRGEMDPFYGGTVTPRSGQAAPGGEPESAATADMVPVAKVVP